MKNFFNNRNAINTIRDLSLSLFLISMSLVVSVGLIYTVKVSTSLTKISSLLARKLEPQKHVAYGPAIYIKPNVNHIIHIKTVLVVKYREGKLLYRGIIKPIDGRTYKYLACLFKKENVTKIIPNLSLILRDKDGFFISRIMLSKDNLRTTVDSNGNPIYYGFEGNMPISLESYKLIKYLDVEWLTNSHCSSHLPRPKGRSLSSVGDKP